MSQSLSPSTRTLSPVALAFARAALSPATERAYAGQWCMWLTWCRVTGNTALPATPEAIADWLADRATQGQAYGRRANAGRTGQSLATLRVAVAAVRLAHLANGTPFDARHPAILLVLKGIARTRPEIVAQAAPARSNLICEILASLGPAPLDRRDAALLALGYCFACRRSELVGLDLERLGTGLGSLVIGHRTLELHLARAKNSADSVVFSVPRANNRIAVDAISRWLAVADIHPGEPILRRITKSGRVTTDRLHAQSVSLILKRRLTTHLRAGGLKPDEAERQALAYSAHSLRVGFAVSAAEAGADTGAIQQALGHRTPVMAARYCRAAHLARTSPHHLPGVGLETSKSKRPPRGTTTTGPRK